MNDNSNKIVGFAGTTEQSIDFSDVYAQTVIGTNTHIHQTSYCDFFFKKTPKQRCFVTSRFYVDLAVQNNLAYQI